MARRRWLLQPLRHCANGELPVPRTMKRSDIADDHVLELAKRWRENFSEPGVIAALMAEGVPEKVAYAKVMHMVQRHLLDYGVSPYYAWPA